MFGGGGELQHVKQNTYLGLNVSHTANFSVAGANLGLKANRASLNKTKCF